MKTTSTSNQVQETLKNIQSRRAEKAAEPIRKIETALEEIRKQLKALADAHAVCYSEIAALHEANPTAAKLIEQESSESAYALTEMTWVVSSMRDAIVAVGDPKRSPSPCGSFQSMSGLEARLGRLNALRQIAATLS
jgi:hypothetical protein